MPIAGVICLGAGFLFGLPALRLEGLYLALATFALAVATPQILKFKGFDHWTGGVQGIHVDPPGAPFGLPLNTDRWTYFFCLIWGIARKICSVDAPPRVDRDPRPPSSSGDDGRRHRALSGR